MCVFVCFFFSFFVFFQAEDGIRDLVRSRGLGDVYKRQSIFFPEQKTIIIKTDVEVKAPGRYIQIGTGNKQVTA